MKENKSKIQLGLLQRQIKDAEIEKNTLLNKASTIDKRIVELRRRIEHIEFNQPIQEEEIEEVDKNHYVTYTGRKIPHKIPINADTLDGY